MSKSENYSQYKTRYAREPAEKAQAGHRCMIQRVSDHFPMSYDEKAKTLTDKGEPTVFSSTRKARVARWHHVQNSGIPMSHVLWEIVPV